MSRLSRLLVLRLRHLFKLVDVATIVLLEVRIDKVNGVAGIAHAVAHLYDELCVDADLVAINHMAAIHQDAVHPVFLSRNKLRGRC